MAKSTDETRNGSEAFGRRRAGKGLRLLVLLLLTLGALAAAATAQNEGKNWFFGNGGGLTFTTTPPTPLSGGQINTQEGCATLSDSSGNLLFYTDGITVWTRTHAVMPNGTGLLGNPSSTQSGIIVPDPANPNKFYVFTISAYTSSAAYFSKVDMTLNGGLGDVETTGKNTPLLSATLEGIQAVPSADNSFWWIIVHHRGSNNFYAFRLTATGVDTASPVISAAGTSSTGDVGYLKANAAGNRLAHACYLGGYWEVFDFDRSTGVVSNAVNLPAGGANTAYGVEFSPSGNLLYASHLSAGIYQYNLLAGSPALIASTRYQVSAASSRGALQSAPDGKIYASVSGAASLDVIGSPNTLGAGCGYAANAQAIAGTCTYGLPNIISSFVSTGPPVVVDLGHSGVTGTEATLSADVLSDGGSPITERGFFYGTSPNPSGNKTPVAGATGPMSAGLSGLTPATVYYYRAFATNANGTANIGDGTFTTSAAATPAITCSSGNLQLVRNAAPIVCDPGLTVTGPDVTDARVVIGGVLAGDTLAFNAGSLPAGVTGNYSAATGVLSFTGTASTAAWQTLLRTVTIATTAAGTTPRTLTFALGASVPFEGNGHFYEFVAASGVSWTDARTAAAARTLFGLQGYLVTVTSAEENAFVQSKLAGYGWMGATDAVSEGVWHWVTGPEGLENAGAGRHFFQQNAACATSPNQGSVYSATPGGGTPVDGNYNNWDGPEPNDCYPGTGEDYAHFYSNGNWNDYPLSLPAIQGYVVEYGGMPGDPSPQIACSRDVYAAHVLTYLAGANGSITGATPQVVNHGEDGSAVTPAPAPGYHFVQWSDGSTANPRQDTNVLADITVTASFAPDNFTVDFQTDGTPGASLSGSLSQTVLPGGDCTAVTALPPGTHYLFNWTGTGGFSSTSNPLTVTNVTQNMTITANFAAKVATTTTVASSQNPSLYGQSVTFSATVLPAGATGTVQFQVDGVDFGAPVALAGGVAVSGATSSLTVGTHAVTAVYYGDTTHLGSSGSLSGGQVVNKANTTTAVISSVNPSVWAQSVTFTATVTAVAPGTGTPTGTVTFRDGATTLGIGTLSGGTATLSTSALIVGTHPITVQYAGDTLFNGSTSPILDQVVGIAPTATSVSVLSNPICPTDSLTLTAVVTAVSPATGIPDGLVTFLDGAATLGTGTLDAIGVASLTVSAPASGTHVITAVYAGSASYQTSQATLSPNLIVNSTAVITGITRPLRVCAGESARMTATVTGTGPFSYAWSVSPDGVSFSPIPGATGSVYTAPSLSSRRVFRLDISGACGGDSQIVVVEVDQPPVITAQPSALTLVGSGESATLSVGYTGTERVSIQWYEGAVGDVSHPVEGANAPVFHTPTVTLETAYWARLTNRCGQADTAAALVRVENVYYFAHAASDATWWTKITFANADTQDNPIYFQAFDTSGTLVEMVEVESFPPGTGTTWSLDELFSPETCAANIWVRALSRSNLKGVESFGNTTDETAAVLAATRQGFLKSVFPYVYQSPASPSYYTGITLVNTSGTDPANVLLEAFTESGNKLTETMVVIPALGKYARLVGETFPGLSSLLDVRSVRVTSNQPLTGFELFGDWTGKGLAGLPLTGLDEVPPPDVYHALEFNEIPNNGQYYTGVTLLNVGDQDARIFGQLYDTDGNVLAQDHWDLHPMEQLTREVWELFDPALADSAAYLFMGSYGWIDGFELMMSRGMPYVFDGLPACLLGTDHLWFPLVNAEPGGTALLHLMNQSDRPMTAVVTLRSATGAELGTVNVALCALGRKEVNLSMIYPALASDIAWVEAGGEHNVILGSLFLRSADGKRLMSYLGLK